MTGKLDSILKKARDPKETIELYCGFLFDLPKDQDFARLTSFSNIVVEEIAKYVVSIPEVTNEIVQSKKEDLDKVAGMIAKYAGCSETDTRMKKIALFFSISCSGMMKYAFGVGFNDLLGLANQDICRMEKEYREIMKSMTKEEFTSFIISGLDALIKTTFENKN